MSPLTIGLLGSVSVEIDDGTPVDLGYDKVRALLAYLAVHHDRTHRRERLAGLLWPEDPDDNARRSLRTCLYQLRNAIHDRDVDPPFLLVTRDTLQLNPDADVWVDVNAFNSRLAAVESHDHERLVVCSSCAKKLVEAADLYQGDLLSGFTLDSAEFEGWLVTQREALHLQALEALSQLAEYYLAQPDHDAALACARRQMTLEPWREHAHRQAMRALALSGQRAAAVAQFETCRQVLTDELGIEPEPATVALYEQIRRGDLAPPAASTSTLPVPPSPSKDAASVADQGVHPLRSEAVDPAAASSGSALERRTEPADRLEIGIEYLGAELRTTSLVIAEITGAEDLLARVGLEAWAETMHHVVDALCTEVERYGGTVVQLRDTGFVAAFGAEVAHEDDVERSVLTALSMAGAVAALAFEIPEATALAVRIGVTIDEAVVLAQEAGGVTVHAATLTVADAIQVQVPPGTVWVTETTYRRVERYFEWAWLAESRELGRLYRPVARATDVSPEHDVGGLRAPLVGRAAELHALTRAIKRVTSGIGGVVTVVGEAGIGKSRLIAETALDADGVRWLEGRWLSYTEGVAYSGWQELLRRLLGLSDDCTQSACVELEEQIATLCPDRADAIYPYVARLLALPVDAATATQLDSLVTGGLLQGAIFRAVRDLLICVASQTPLVLVLEDVHWADEASLELLESLMPLTDRAPLLLLLTLRPVRTQRCWRVWETAVRDYGHRHTAISLAPLSPDESEALIHHLLALGAKDAESDVDLVRRLQSRAEGNPFFTAEIVRSWMDGDMVADAVVPATVRELLMARIDRLPAMARQVLQLAAVIGRTFRYRVLADITLGAQEGEGAAPDRGVLDAALLRLLRAQMIREQAPAAHRGPDRIADRAFTFEHQLTLEAAYGSLLQRKRRILHRRVAEALERLYPEQVVSQLGVLAHHLERAGETDRAVDYLRRAGEQAAGQYANAEAVAFFTRALALVPDADIATRYALLLRREHIHDLAGDRGAENRDLDQLEALAAELNSPRKQAEVALRRAQRNIKLARPRKAVAEAETALGMAGDVGDPRLLALAHLYLGQGLSAQASSRAGLDHLARAAAIAQAAGAPDIEGRALRERGLWLMHSGRRAEGRQVLEQALAAARAAGDLAQEANVLDALAITIVYAGDYVAAVDLLQEGLRLQREVGNRYDEGYALQALGWTCYVLGRYGEARSTLILAEGVFCSVDDPLGLGYARTDRAELLIDLGAYEASHSVYQEVLDQIDVHGEIWPALKARAGLATMAYLRGEYARTRENVEHLLIALDSAETFVDTHAYFRVWGHLIRGHAALSEGDLDAARDGYERACRALADPEGPIVMRPNFELDVRAGMAALAEAEGDREQALEHVTEILDPLLHGEIAGALEPMQIYLTAYRILHAAGDPRADDVLVKGHEVMMARAATIEDADLRRSYLKNVEANRRLLATCEAFAGGERDRPAEAAR